MLLSYNLFMKDTLKFEKFCKSYYQEHIYYITATSVIDIVYLPSLLYEFMTCANERNCKVFFDKAIN